jgi:hypothetical protein
MQNTGVVVLNYYIDQQESKRFKADNNFRSRGLNLMRLLASEVTSLSPEFAYALLLQVCFV